MLIPLLSSSVKAGFPSPAEDFIEQKLDLNELIIRHPVATFFVRVEGESMQDANIHSGDILVVDKAEEVHSGQIVVAIVEGEFTVKRLVRKKEKLYLASENNKAPLLEISPETDFRIWGVVTYVIHPCLP